MVLAPHAVAGAATMLIFRTHPVLGFFAAFASHFVLDAIPHWHYRIDSEKKDSSAQFGKKLVISKTTLFDLGKITIDLLIGFLFTWIAAKLAFPNHLGFMMFGALGAVIPDALQVPYYLFPHSPFKYLQQFHVAVHSKKRIDDRHAFGIASQVIFSAAILALLAVI